MLLFLNRCYWPDSEATGQLLTDLCESLASSYDVHVVCGQPNSPTEAYQSVGVEPRNGVTIHRLAHTRFSKRVPAGRAMNLVSFSRAASSYLRRARLLPEIVISETDPFLLPLVAAAHARRSAASLVCYLQDIYPDVAEAIGKVSPGLITRQLRGRLREAYRAADRVIVLGECMRRRLQSPPWCLPGDTIEVIPNWADCEAIRPLPAEQNAFRARQGLQDKFVVMHSGNMGLTQRLDVLVEATQHRQWPEQAVLQLIGDGAARPRLMALAEQSVQQRVRLLPYQPRETLCESLSAADLHVVSMHEKIGGCLCPSKLYGILSAGRPVLAIADESTDLCRTVTELGLGWCCRPGDARQIAAAVADAEADAAHRIACGRRAREVACDQFDRTIAVGRFQHLIQDVLDRRRAHPFPVPTRT